MYHKVSESESKGLTISVEKLEEQCAYLQSTGYRSIHFTELLNSKALPASKLVVLSFDDGYVNQMELAVPILQKYGLKATFFIPLDYLGKSDSWNHPSEAIMTATQLKQLPDCIELAYHSFSHGRFDAMPLEAIDHDTYFAVQEVAKHGLRFSPVLAYPYGKYPRKQPQKNAFIKIMQRHGMQLGVRIGNRINRFPFLQPFEVQRVDIKGEFNLKKFRWKLKFGKNWF